MGTEPRLATHIWLSAYRARLDHAAIGYIISAKGDATAGAVMVKLSTMDGKASCYGRQFDIGLEKRVWRCLKSGQEAEIDALLARERQRDGDLWIVEIEDRLGRHFLELEHED